MTSDNRQWAFNEAKRRVKAMDDAYSIYRKGNNYIVRNTAAGAPQGWDLEATFQPDGTQSFKRESANDQD